MNSKDTVGGSYYDNVSGTNAPTTWEYILKSESLRKKSFGAIANNEGYITEKVHDPCEWSGWYAWCPCKQA